MALVSSFISQGCPPKSKFAVDDIPDLTGKVMIVTGGYAGIGKETVKALLSKNATVYIAGRDPNKASAAIAELQTVTQKTAKFLPLDLSDLKSVKAAAEEFSRNERELHVLFNNAGVMFPPVEQLTRDGHDLQFGTNVLGHFYLTKLLLPVLLSTASSSSPGTVRIVNTSSFGAYFGNIDFNTFKDGPARKKLSTHALYFQSKLGNVVYCAELARRYGGQGIVITSLNPGNIKTELQRHVSNLQSFLTNALLFQAPSGALTQLWAGTSEEGKDLNGKFLIPWARIGPCPANSQDEELGSELWKWCEEQVKDI